MNKRGSFLIALGLLLLVGALGLTIYNVWDSNRAGEASAEVAQEVRTLLATMETVGSEEGEETAEGEAETSDPEETAETEEAAEEETGETEEPTETEDSTDTVKEMPTVTVNGYRYIGIIEVESMDISLPVMEEWDYDRLKIAPCRFAGNVYEDSLVICAHNYATHFAPLKYAPIGTEVKFTDAEGNEYYYQVISIDTVGPNDVEGMIYGDWDLTLFTCNTNGQTRCAIRCQRVA